MKRSRKPRFREPGVLDLIEEAFYLLRRAPVGVLLLYYLGTLPFCLAFLYFWTDMSLGNRPWEYMEAASLGLALVFIWMKYWQSRFTRELLALLCHETLPPIRWRRETRRVIFQTLIQSTGLFILPLATILMFPFAWVYAFYQNVTVLGETDEGVGRLIGQAWSQSQLQPLRNYGVLLCLSFFSLFVFLNLAAALYTIPSLIKSLLGVSSLFTISGSYVFNSTFLAVNGVLTYLAMDPVFKAVYVLRCFYGLSRRTGRDLKVELAALTHLIPIAITVLIFGINLGIVSSALAQDNQPLVVAEPTVVDSAELDRAITDVLTEPKYSWRFPREKPPEDEGGERGLIGGLFEWLGKKMRAGLKAIGRAIERAWDWFRSWLPDSPKPDRRPPSGSGWRKSADVLLWIGVTVAAAILAVVLWRSWKSRERRVIATAVDRTESVVPDLEDENTGAEELPGDGWMDLARRLMAEGSLRLALRAIYLATLAGLAENQLISLAGHKSNRDYRRELERRLNNQEDITTGFAGQSASFDRAWYGEYDVTADDLKQATTVRQNIMAAVKTAFEGPPSIESEEYNRD